MVYPADAIGNTQVVANSLILCPQGQWQLLLPSNPRRLALYFLCNTNFQNLAIIPSLLGQPLYDPAVASTWTTIKLQWQWEIDGPLISGEWWACSGAAGGQSIGSIEELIISDVPRQVGSVLSSVPSQFTISPQGMAELNARQPVSEDGAE